MPVELKPAMPQSGYDSTVKPTSLHHYGALWWLAAEATVAPTREITAHAQLIDVAHADRMQPSLVAACTGAGACIIARGDGC